MRLSKGASVGGLLVFGTITSLSAKIAYEIQVNGEFFRRPWAMTTLMFLGMSLCLPLAYAPKKKKETNGAPESDPLLGELELPSRERNELKETLLLSIPTLFDLIATVLMNVGLLYVTASVYQMMRGAEMLFAALFAVVFLKRKLNHFHYLGILCCLVGITLVGLSSVFAPPKTLGLTLGGSAPVVPSQFDILFGISLIVISQAVQAAQITFEDFFMADMNIEAIKIVGYEGLFGLVAMFGFMLWIVSALPVSLGEGLHEDVWETFRMIGQSKPLIILLSIDTFALLMYNVSGMMVTGHLGAVFRTVLETVRTLFVWAVDLFLFYVFPTLGLGERWSSTSYIQLVGFAVLVTGTLVYGKGDEYTAAEEYKELGAAMAEETEGGVPPADYDPTNAAPISFAPTAPARPISIGAATPSSLKVTMTMVTGSYSHSVPRSYGRSYGRNHH